MSLLNGLKLHLTEQAALMTNTLDLSSVVSASLILGIGTLAGRLSLELLETLRKLIHDLSLFVLNLADVIAERKDVALEAWTT